MIAVVDGDTIKVRLADGGRETVRLVGIDTPESRKPNTPVECGAKQAGAALSALVGRRDVTLVRDPSQDARDRYGRTLAYVDVGSRDAGEEMVRSGWAEPYVYEVPFARLREYRAAESAAKRRGAGVHGVCESDFHRATLRSMLRSLANRERSSRPRTRATSRAGAARSAAASPTRLAAAR